MALVWTMMSQGGGRPKSRRNTGGWVEGYVEHISRFLALWLLQVTKPHQFIPRSSVHPLPGRPHTRL